MADQDQVAITMRIVIERPVIGVLHSLQTKDGGPLDPKRSAAGEPIALEFCVQVAPGSKVFGDQVCPEGPRHCFVYVAVGKLAGDTTSRWSRRMKIDVHNVEEHLLNGAANGAVIEITIAGTTKDGTPSSAMVRPKNRRLV